MYHKAGAWLFTFSILYDALHQDGVLCDPLSHQQKTLRDTQPSHDGQLANFLWKRNVSNELYSMFQFRKHTHKQHFIDMILNTYLC